MNSEIEIVGRDLDIDVSDVFAWNYESKKRIKVNEGGSGSSKTFSILQVLLLKHGLEKQNQIISIVRPTLAELKQTAMRDFFNILESNNLYNERFHNKTANTYEFNNNVFEFFGMDKGAKRRGASRDILYCNEIMPGMKWDDWLQLYMRTSADIYIDYNPSEYEHFVYDKIILNPETGLQDDDVDFFKSTYLNNPFLPEQRRRMLERLINIDPDAAKVYSFGQRVKLRGQIFTNWEAINIFPHTRWKAYGIDFGFTNDVTAITRVGLSDGCLYTEQLCYKTGMLARDINDRLIECGVTKDDEIFADSANPMTIAELKAMGWNIMGAKKGDGSVKYGIDLLKQYKIYIKGTDAIDEAKKYKWKINESTGVVLNVPVDAFNHFWDSVRYVAIMKLGEQNKPVKRAKPRGI